VDFPLRSSGVVVPVKWVRAIERGEEDNLLNEDPRMDRAGAGVGVGIATKL
jgi:hypothetical protein